MTDCPNCGNTHNKYDLLICKANCDEIVCEDCKVEHMYSVHADFDKVDDMDLEDNDIE
jgi:hypothetical protein